MLKPKPGLYHSPLTRGNAGLQVMTWRMFEGSGTTITFW